MTIAEVNVRSMLSHVCSLPWPTHSWSVVDTFSPRAALTGTSNIACISVFE